MTLSTGVRVGVRRDGGAGGVVVAAGSLEIEHIESAHYDAELEALKAAGGSWAAEARPGQ